MTLSSLRRVLTDLVSVEVLTILVTMGTAFWLGLNVDNLKASAFEAMKAHLKELDAITAKLERGEISKDGWACRRNEVFSHTDPKNWDFSKCE